MARPELNTKVLELCLEMKALFENHRPSDALTAIELQLAGMVRSESTDMAEVTRDVEWISSFVTDRKSERYQHLDGKAKKLVDAMKAGKPAKQVVQELQNMAQKEVEDQE